MRNSSSLAAIALVVASVAIPVHAQSTGGTAPVDPPVFGKGMNIVGPRIGFPSQGGGIALGGNFERGLSQSVGLGAFADYWGYDEGGLEYSYTAVGGTFSYHYKMQDRKLDPFTGVSVGYYIVSVDVDDLCEAVDCRLSRGFIGGFAGIRYFVNPRVAASLRAGFGAAYLTAGLDVRL